MVTQNTGGRIIPPAASTVPVHKHNVADLIGLGTKPVNGGVPVYNSTTGTWTITVPSSATSPVVTPNAPTITAVTSTAYFNTGQVNAATSVSVTIADPTTNTDGSAYYGTSFYAIRWRYEDTTLSVTPSAWTVVQSLVGSNTITFYNVRPATTISIQAMVMDRYNNPSGWSVTSSATTYIDPAAPGQPTTPTLVSKLGGILLTWDGLVVSGTSTVAQPPDYLYTDIFVSATSGFTPSASLKVGRLNGAGVFLIMQDGSGANLTNGTRYYVKLVSYDVVLQGSVSSTETSALAQFLVSTEIGTGQITSGMAAFNARQIGGITTTVGSTTPTSPVAGDIWLDTSSGTGVTQKTWSGSAWTTIQLNSSSIAANTITATQIAAGAITAGSAIISTAAINSAQIADLSVAKLTAGNLSVIGTLTAGGAIQTAATGARTVLDSTGLHGYNSTGSTPIFDLTTSGTFALNSSGSTTGARLVLNTSGLTAYNSSGTSTVSINSDGSASFSGTLTAATITGTTTISGGTIQTGTSGARVVMTASGLTAYNTAGSSIFDINNTKSVITGGDIVSGTINSSKVTGSAIAGSFFTTGSNATYDAVNGWSSSGSRIEIDGTSGPNANSLFITGITNASFETYPAAISFNSVTAVSSPNASTLSTIIKSPANSSVEQATIKLNGSGSGPTYWTGSVGAPGTTLGDFIWGSSPYIKIQASQAYEPWYFSSWMRAGFTAPATKAAGGDAEIKRSDSYAGFMNQAGFYILMQDSQLKNTFLSAGYLGVVAIRANGNALGVKVTTAGLEPEDTTTNLGKAYVNSTTVGPWANIYSLTNVVVASDRRIKNTVTPVSDSGLAMSFVQALKPVSYKLTDKGVRTHTGFIAQDVKEALDQCAVNSWAGWIMSDPSDPDSYQSLRYEEFIAPLVAAVQNVDSRLSALETRQTRSNK